MKNKQIADRLFNSETTVQHHLSSIRKVSGGSLELVIYAYRHNL
jgi:DNA-binding NarL/FixJ family response regulator